MKWLRSETGVRCLLALCFLLILSMGALIYEAMGLISDLKNYISLSQTDKSMQTDSFLDNADLNNTDTGKDLTSDLLVKKRVKRFASTFLLLLLGVTIIVLVFSLKQFGRMENPDIDSKNSALAILDSIDYDYDDVENGSPEKSFNKMFEALQKVNDLEDDLSDEDIHGKKIEEKNGGALASSYNKMMEALQKVNELEKKHTIELAAANELLENEVTERERAEKEIRHLSRKLISGIEEAQKKLAQDLHDEFGQTLAALHMGVETLLNSMPENMVSQRKHIDDLIVFIENLGDKIRSISSDLRPDLLDDLGLVPTLEWYIKEFVEQRPDIHINFQAVGFKKRLSSEIELVFYRIFQESLNNVVKHSKADNVDVMLTYSYPKAILMVKDNGKGFDTDKRSSGIGLIGMRERAVSIKGQVDIRSEKDKGTTIRIEIPVS